MPFFASTADFALGGRRRNVAVSILLALLAFGVSVWVTSHAYHIGNAYRALPSIHDFLTVGLGWALVATTPSLIAIMLRKRTWTGALLIGAVASFCALILIAPLNFGLTMMLSFE